MNTASGIEIRGVSKIYGSKTGGVTALESFDLDLAAGEFIGVVGRPAAASRPSCVLWPGSSQLPPARSLFSAMSSKARSMIADRVPAAGSARMAQCLGECVVPDRDARDAC
jgi:hypothetical protein